MPMWLARLFTLYVTWGNFPLAARLVAKIHVLYEKPYLHDNINFVLDDNNKYLTDQFRVKRGQ